MNLPPYVVGESRASEFYIRAEQGDVTRLWFMSVDAPCRPPVESKRPGCETRVYLGMYRSFDLQCGDEIISINGRPVANMKWNEWLRALRSASDEPPVSVDVRAKGAQGVRHALVVIQNSVTLGAKVPRTH